MKQPSTIAVGTQQNYSHHRCYARILDNCSAAISREHFISETILRQQKIAGKVNVFGFNFLGDESKPISTNALASKILCEAHNSALSPLDSEAGRLFKYSLDIALSFHQAPLINIFSGEDIELWLLKSFLGMFYSKQIQALSFDGLSKGEYKIDSSLVEILFQKRRWPKRWGLYISGEMYPCDGSFLMQPNVENNIVTGAHIRFCGLQFFLNLGAKDFGALWFDFPNVPKFLKRHYRPHTIKHHRGGDTRQLVLTWQNIGERHTDSRHGHFDYYHIPESEQLPIRELASLLDLMKDPNSALDKYLMSNLHRPQ